MYYSFVLEVQSLWVSSLVEKNKQYLINIIPVIYLLKLIKKKIQGHCWELLPLPADNDDSSTVYAHLLVRNHDEDDLYSSEQNN